MKNDDRPTHACPNNWMIKKCQKLFKYSCNYIIIIFIITRTSFAWIYFDDFLMILSIFPMLNCICDYNGYLWSKGILSAGTRLNVRWHIETIISSVNLGISVARLYKKFFILKNSPREPRNNSDSLRFLVRWTSVIISKDRLIVLAHAN